MRMALGAASAVANPAAPTPRLPCPHHAPLSAPQEALNLSDKQAELVRVVRVESRRADNAEDPSRVQLSKVGKAAQLQLSEDRLSVTGHKGFRTVRASRARGGASKTGRPLSNKLASAVAMRASPRSGPGRPSTVTSKMRA